MRINSLIYIKSMEKYQHMVCPICGDSVIKPLLENYPLTCLYASYLYWTLSFWGVGFLPFLPVFTFVFPLLCTVCLLHSNVKTIILQQYIWIYLPCESCLNLIPRATRFQEGLPYTSGLAGCACSDINIAHSYN